MAGRYGEAPEGCGIEPMNPFDCAFEMLHALREEIAALHSALAEEQAERARETGELRQQLIEVKNAKHEKFDAMCNVVEDLRQARNSRFEQLESYVEEIRATRTKRFDILSAKVDAEICHREHSCKVLDHAIQIEVAKLLATDEKLHKDLAAQRKTHELTCEAHKTANEDLKQEVERLARILRDNSMMRDPLKNFVRRPVSSHPSGATPRIPDTSERRAHPTEPRKLDGKPPSRAWEALTGR